MEYQYFYMLQDGLQRNKDLHPFFYIYLKVFHNLIDQHPNYKF